MNENEMMWWKSRSYQPFGDHHNTIDWAWFVLGTAERTLDGGPPMLVQCLTEGSCNVEKAVEAVQSIGLRLVLEMHGDRQRFVLAHEHAVVEVQRRRIEYASDDAALFARLNEAMQSCFQVRTAVDAIYMLAKAEDGYRLKPIGAAGCPLERGNYAAEVLADFDHVAADLNAQSPCGRLIVLTGEPGSGKSFLVRGLLSAGVKARFVLVPPHLVGELGDPDVLPSLVDRDDDDEDEDEHHKALVLVLEDGDMCLVPRMGDNMSTVQSVLNLGDGLLGSLLGVRLLVTTNAPKLKMDTAVTRDGRLCRNVEVGRLSFLQCHEILRRLGINEAEATHAFDGGQHVLAKVYKKARELGWTGKKEGT